MVNTDDGRAHESIAMANGRVSKRAKQNAVQICFTRKATIYKKHYHLAVHDTAIQRPSITIRK